MRIVLWLILSSLVWAAPGGGGNCHYSGYRSYGYYGGGYYGSRRAHGPTLPFEGGSPPGYDSEEQRTFPKLNSNRPPGALAPFTPRPFDPSRVNTGGNNPFQITHSQDKAPPGYDR
jgi:hypothetical protein